LPSRRGAPATVAARRVERRRGAVVRIVRARVSLIDRLSTN